jgi:deoxycytidylate deaminase
MAEVSRGALRWLARAAELAGRASGHHRLGAVLVRGGSVIAVGYNSTRNDPRNTDGCWSVQAETRALRQAGAPRGATLYVARVTPGGRTALARPCEDCASDLRAAGVDTVVYTTDDGAASERVRELAPHG